LLVVAQLVWALRIFERGHPARRAAIASMILMLTEAAIGAGIVLLELVGDDASLARAGWIALHLVNTFLLVAALVLTAHHARPEVPARDAGGGVGWMIALGTIAMLLTGVSGAITALGDTLFPAASLAEGLAQDLSPAQHFLVRLRIIHPVIAVVTAILGAMIAGMVPMLRPDPGVRRAAVAFVSVIAVQVIVGLVNVALLAPIAIQLVHLLLADLAWIALVLLGARALAAPRAQPAPHGERHVAPTTQG
jgi:heme A synthase